MKQMTWHVWVGPTENVPSVVWLGHKPFMCKYLLVSSNLTSQDFPSITMDIPVSYKAGA